MPDAPAAAALPLPDEAATRRFGSLLARMVQAGDLILLSGPLGIGKTSLSRAFLRGLSGQPIDVPSPTFTLVEIYELDPCPVWHADLYRIEDAGDVEELGLDEALAEGVVLVEWPEHAGPDWAGARRQRQLALGLAADPARPQGRRLVLEAWGSWAMRLPALVNGFTSGPPAS